MHHWLWIAKLTLITVSTSLYVPKSLSAQESQPAKPVVDLCEPLPAGAVTIGGWLGERMDICLENRVMSQDIALMVEPFAKCR